MTREFWIWICLLLNVSLTFAEEEKQQNNRTKRTIIGYYPICPPGCTSCSMVNGCVTCEARRFMYLHRSGMTQKGYCMHTCPMPYFGARKKGYRYCSKCRIPNCKQCHSRHYCIRCEPGYAAIKGHCIKICSEDEKSQITENNDKMLHCVSNVDCQVTRWSKWGPCLRKGETCGYKHGVQTRTRAVLQQPLGNVRRCPSLLARKRCKMTMRKCVDLISNHSEPRYGNNEPSKGEKSWSRDNSWHNRRRKKRKQQRANKRRKRRQRKRNRKHRVKN
ncbi:R-spondin-2-like [Tubulanus polymorphus]|uniref:R-spondin-2-like n=1 Tax=Tubulanus polymorphus TaxID=672921 RepID=UPI003DA20C70